MRFDNKILQYRCLRNIIGFLIKTGLLNFILKRHKFCSKQPNQLLNLLGVGSPAGHTDLTFERSDEIRFE